MNVGWKSLDGWKLNGRNLNESSDEVRRMSDESLTYIGWKSNNSLKNVGWVEIDYRCCDGEQRDVAAMADNLLRCGDGR